MNTSANTAIPADVVNHAPGFSMDHFPGSSVLLISGRLGYIPLP
jgi:hypothetical protein